MLSSPSSRSSRGFTLIELAIVLGVSATLMVGLWRLMSSGGAQLRDQTAASQHQQIIAAARTYLSSSEGQAWLQTHPGALLTLQLPDVAGTCTADSAHCLAGYLPSGFTVGNSPNAYGQTFQPIQISAGPLSASGSLTFYSFLTFTRGGDTIPDTSGGRLASMIGGDGGFIYSNNTNACGTIGWACGAYGAWGLDVGSFGVGSPGAGHIVSRTYVAADQDTASPWLARYHYIDDTYNTMSVNLYMAGTSALVMSGTGSNIFLASSSGTAGGSVFMRSGCISGTDEACGTGSSGGGMLDHLNQIFVYNSSGIGVTVTATTALQANGNVNVTGEVHAVNGFIYDSDARLKEQIEPLKGSLEKIAQLKPSSFVFKKDQRASMGFIAQDLEKVYPILVHNRADGLKAVDYALLVGPLVAAVQELNQQNQDLRTRLEKLEAVVKKLQGDK